jgi:uncharacterized surface protein with fasciclin (FAS1) repeats
MFKKHSLGLAGVMLVTSMLTDDALAGGGKNIVQTAVGAGQFKTLATALQAADLVSALEGEGPFTVFAPTDEAFAKLPKGTVESLLMPNNRDALAGILKYHVVSGSLMAGDVVGLSNATTLNGQRIGIRSESGKVMIDGATITKTDIACSNGVIHVIDTVILPADKNIVETAVGAGQFKTLTAALSAVGLASALEGEGPFTVFAPTDAAFAKLPPGTVENLLKPENREQLAGILKYHVVSGRVYADQVVGMDSTKTLGGKALSIRTSGDNVMIGDATVVNADIEASNGVIHVVDTVLIPE